MKKILFLLSLTALVVVVFIFIGKQTQKSTLSNRKKIAATIFPLYDMTKHIAGDQIDVVLVLPPGASPHSYDASPEDVKSITGSDALFMIGHGLDNWSSNIAQSAGVKKSIIVDKNVKLHEFSEESGKTGEDEDHDYEGIDPHYWISVKNSIRIAKQIRDELSVMYPEYSETFAANYTEYETSLSAVDEELTAIFAGKKKREFATFHNAWSYFAEDYDLKIVTTFEEYPGEEPSPEYLNDFSKKIEEYNLQTVYAEPQLATTGLKAIANDLGVSILIIDPIGGTESLSTYIDVLRYNGLEISKSL